VEIKKETLFPLLIYNKPVKYTENIILYPVTMNDVVEFQTLSLSITVRKNSTFHEKKIIKMTYLDFLLYCLGNEELEAQYKIFGLSHYFFYAFQLLQLCCRDAEIKLNQQTGQIIINGEVITPQMFDDLRRIIIIQNDIDFDIDEFLNYDTEQRLLKAQKDLDKDKDKANIEDYIDSLVIAMHTTEDRIMNMTIRKFWRYVKRYNLHENYTIMRTGECSGMVSFKEPIKHWMISLEEDDKYKHLKADENEIRSKIG
jgi:hypothetical protein